jgi:hypothetical protein
MEFLYRLYSNDYFGIGLFIVITILAFSFLVILFFGKKDEKQRNEEIKNNNISSNDIETHESESKVESNSLETVSLPVSEEPKINETIEEPVKTAPTNNDTLTNVVLNSNLVESTNEEPASPSITPKQDSTDDIFNLDSIADAISAELNKNEEPTKSNTTIEPDFNPFEMERPIIEEEVKPNIFSDNITANEPDTIKIPEEQPKKVVMPNQFSSVYLSKETPIKTEEVKEVVNEPEDINPIPLKPEFDLPKPFDLPKLNKVDERPKETSISENNSNLNNIFGNIEEDSYTIEK